jgi:hypothetical protein
VEAPTVASGWGSHIFRHLAHRWWQSCQPYAPAPFLSPERFLVLISVRGWVDPRAIVRLEGLSKFKKSTSSRTRTGDLPACSGVPQPTTRSRASCIYTCIFTKRVAPRMQRSFGYNSRKPIEFQYENYIKSIIRSVREILVYGTWIDCWL